MDRSSKIIEHAFETTVQVNEMIEQLELILQRMRLTLNKSRAISAVITAALERSAK